MPAELSGVICGGIVLLPHVYVTCMCVYVNVVACSEKNLLDRADRVFVLIIIIIIIIIIIATPLVVVWELSWASRESGGNFRIIIIIIIII